MKKKIVIMLLLILMPINILAYSEEVIVGGDNIGIEITSKGIIVVGYYKVNNKYVNKSNLKLGDIILKINGEDINNIDEFSSLINKYVSNNSVNITVLRNNKEKDVILDLVKDNNYYKTGLYVKKNLIGIGTITYIDPNTKIYGALGHEITESNTGQMIDVLEGKIYKSEVSSIRKSVDGDPGSKNAKIRYEAILGNIMNNTKTGIYGKYNEISNNKKLSVASFDEIKKGKATIYTVLKDNEVKEYEIEITGLYKNKIDTAKSIAFKVTDERLLNESGGIVQGMSGSPIIQNNKIIGAVTNVLVDDVKKGYAVFIRTMLEEGDRVLE